VELNNVHYTKLLHNNALRRRYIACFSDLHFHDCYSAMPCQLIGLSLYRLLSYILCNFACSCQNATFMLFTNVSDKLSLLAKK